MFDRIIIIGLVFFISKLPFISAQNNSQTIRGIVRDAENKTPLTGAAVNIRNVAGKYGLSNEEGRFRIEEVPVGRHQIEVTLLGYNSAILNNIDVTSGKEIVLDIELIEKVYQTKEIVVESRKTNYEANNEMSTLSARSFNREETNRYAGGRGDPSKMVAAYAGVSSGNDARNDIIVRGNSPLGVLWRLENMDIPSPNHFSAQGATGGPISILNNNLLAASDFFTGAWPSEYGNKMAAVFDLKMRNGNNEKHEYTGQVGINGFELGAEGPFTSKHSASYLINYRYSTFTLFSKLGINFGVSGVPTYQDISWKINIPLKKGGSLQSWGIGGSSNIALLDSEKKNSDWSFTGSGTDLIYGSQMGATGLAWTHFITKNIWGKLGFSSNIGRFIASVDTLSVNGDKFRTFENDNRETQQQLQYLFNYKINRQHLLKAGFNSTLLGINYNTTQYSRKFSRNISLLNENSNAGLLRIWLAWQYKITNTVTLNSGAYFQHFLLNKSQSAEPRLGIKWQLNDKHSLSAAAGLHSQMQPIIYYFYKTYNQNFNTYTYTNKNLNFSFSRQVVLAYEIKLNQKWRIRSENYYQYLYNIPVAFGRDSWFSMINSGSDIDGLELVDSLVNSGTGYNKGTEFTIEKVFSDKYYLLISSSFYDAKYKGSDGIIRHSAFSGSYVINLLSGTEWPLKKNKYVLGADLKATTAGGNRYTPLNIEASKLAGNAVYYNEYAYSSTFPAFKKIDLKINFRFNGTKTSQSIFFSLENIFGWKNILRQYYDPRLQILKTEYQFTRFPIGGYRIEF